MIIDDVHANKKNPPSQPKLVERIKRSHLLLSEFSEIHISFELWHPQYGGKNVPAARKSPSRLRRPPLLTTWLFSTHRM